MSKTRGRFVWFDLYTTDLDRAIEFYEKVIGWQANSWGGDSPYKMWSRGDRNFGGVTPIGEELKSLGVAPGWLGYVSVVDVDAATQQAVEAGAKMLVPVRDIPQVGRWTVLRDPWGAYIAPFTPDGPDLDFPAPLPGAFSWHELFTSDSTAAMRFYIDAFGWKPTEDMQMGPNEVYRMFGAPNMANSLGGMFTAPNHSGPGYWNHYIRVANLEAAVKAIKAGGGEVLMGPMEVPGGNRVVQGRDPQGAYFSLDSAPA